jgi:molybdopterin/thiamine biosynthesis adenylyltransferase
MIRTLAFTKNDFDALRAHVLQNVGGSGDEEAAIVLAGTSRLSGEVRVLVRGVVPVPRAALLRQAPAGLEVDPVFLATHLKRCRVEELSFLLAHSHPFSMGRVAFSGIDDGGERELMPKVFARAPRGPHGAIVIGQTTMAARIWESGTGGAAPVDIVRVVGGALTETALTGRHHADAAFDAIMFDRQIRAIGLANMERVRRLTIAIVGVGGTGSQAFQQLLRSGFRRFILVDPDRVGQESVARVAGAVSDDVAGRTFKTAIMAREARRFDPDVEVIELRASVYEREVALRLREADVIIGATDTMVSRVVISRLATQYLIPVIDTGIDIQLDADGAVHRIGGRVTLLYADGPCLDCLGVIDHDALHREVHGDALPRGYAGDEPVPAASIVPHNALVAAAAVAALLRLIAAPPVQPADQVFWVYDGLRGTIRPVALRAVRECGVCADARGRGDSVQLPCTESGALTDAAPPAARTTERPTTSEHGSA